MRRVATALVATGLLLLIRADVPALAETGDPPRIVIVINGINSAAQCGDLADWAPLWKRLTATPELGLMEPAVFQFSYFAGTGGNCVNANQASYAPGDTCGSIDGPEGHSDRFQKWFSRLAHDNPKATFDIIGHSMGGLVVAYWATQHSAELGRVHAIITLDSPLQGVNRSKGYLLQGECSRDSPAFDDLVHESTVVEAVLGYSPTGVITGPLCSAGRRGEDRLVSSRPRASPIAHKVKSVGNASDRVVMLGDSCLPGGRVFRVDEGCDGDALDHGCVFRNDDVLSQVVRWMRDVPPPPSDSPAVSNPVFALDGSGHATFSGGTVAQLESAIFEAGAIGAWAQDRDGVFRLLVVGAPAFVNADFDVAFPQGFGGATTMTPV